MKEQSHGSVRRSGKTAKPKITKKKRKKRTNGESKEKTDWESVAHDLNLKLSEAESQMKGMTKEVETLRESLTSLKKDYSALKKKGLDGRHQVKLRNLEHLWSRLVNHQAVCSKDQAKMKELIAQYQYALRTELNKT